MGKIESKLKKMGLEIPPTHPYPSPNRTSAVQAGNILFLSGHGTGRQAMPLNIKQYGKVGGTVTEEEAYVCAKSAALCMLASIKAAVPVPVIASDTIHDPALAEAVVADGRADFVSMARPNFADPDLAAKIDTLWPEINAIISGLVALYNALSVLGFAIKAAAAVA